MRQEYAEEDKACRDFEGAEQSPTVRTPSSKPPARTSGLRLVTRLDDSPVRAPGARCTAQCSAPEHTCL